MRIDVKAGKLGKAQGGLIVVGACEGEQHPDRLLPAPVNGDRALRRLVQGSGLRGAANETALLPNGRGWVLVVGLGRSNDLSIDRARQFAATAAKAARVRQFTRVTLPVLRGAKLNDAAEVAQAMAEGVVLGLYRYTRLKEVPKHERRQHIEAVTLVIESSRETGAVKKAVAKAHTIAQAVLMARDLINGPSNIITPTYLARQARAIAKAHRLKCAVTPFAQLKRRGFGGIVGVAQGSPHPAQFIVLDYRPARVRATFALCGKGITFDTGGISIKPSAKMELMKYDMAGAAAVLGAVQAAAALKLPLRVVGIIAATENMPSGNAQKPGDVVTTLSGKTVEVLNTDAEGRLVLSDCLHYAKRFKPDCTVDLATLTGACVVALGSEAVGLMTPDDRLASRLIRSGDDTHERLWRLPLWEEYGPAMKSDIADLRNVTNTGEAGTITAAKFLEEFTRGLKSWAHLDIAGTAWADRDKPYVPKGAVGIGVRLLVNLMERWT